MSIICDANVSQSRVTFRMMNVAPRTVLDALEQSYGLNEIVRDGVVRLVLAASVGTSLGRRGERADGCDPDDGC